jgi:hypothetical protein
MQQRVEVQQVLLPERLVEVILRIEVCEGGRGQVFFRVERTAGRRVQHQIAHRNHGKNGRNDP